jgi:CheY-like chemotaxis protein
MTTLNSILDLSEIESNNSLLNIRDYNLSVNSRYLLNSYERYALEKGLYYKFIVNDPDICAIADERLMNQIIINLVDNAIKFCNKGGVEIIIDSEDSNDGTFSYFIVKDSGIGISKDKLDVIFTEFRQASEGFSRRYEGAGLGLTIARKMVELMKGAITVESEIGVGSSFTVKLPGVRILPETFKSSPISENCIISNETDNEKESPYNILLVEDNTINAEVIINFLKYKSKIDHVENGSNALNKVTEKLYDLILMDINLGPGMNGIEICNRIRKIEQYKYIPIIALTGYTLSDDRDNLLTSGFDNYIAKPFTKDEIIKIVDKTLKL